MFFHLFMHLLVGSFFKKNSYLRICLLILKREEGKEREREKHHWEGSIDQLPPIRTTIGD